MVCVHFSMATTTLFLSVGGEVNLVETEKILVRLSEWVLYAFGCLWWRKIKKLIYFSGHLWNNVVRIFFIFDQFEEILNQNLRMKFQGMKI